MLPTFSYSWCNGESYDPASSECRLMGAFGATIWREPGFVRSSNPNFSIAAISFAGDDDDIRLLYDVDNTCFGEKSVFGNIYRRSRENPTYIVLLGGAHSDCIFRCTFVHYVEEKVGIDYRYKKKFYDPGKKDEYVTQLVKYLTDEEFRSVTGGDCRGYSFPVEHDYTQLGEDMIADGIIKIAPFGYSQTRIVKLDTFCDYLEAKLKENPRYILKKSQAAHAG